jgi:hypothetical protein
MGGYNHYTNTYTTTTNNNDDINSSSSSSSSSTNQIQLQSNEMENIEPNSIMYHIQFDEGDIWSNKDLLRISLLRNSPFKSKDKFDAIISILFNHEVLNIYNNEIKQFISTVVKKMINNKASYKLFRLPSSSSSSASTSTSTSSTTAQTIISSLDNKKRKNYFIENTNTINVDNCVCLEENNFLETSIITYTATAEPSSSILIGQYNNAIAIGYHKSVGTKYKKKSENKNNNNLKAKYYKKNENSASTVVDYYSIATMIRDDDHSVTTTASTTSDDLYTFDASSIFDDLNDRINFSSSSPTTTSFSSVQIKSTMMYDNNNDINDGDDLQPWDFLNDNYFNNDVLKIAPQLIYKNNDYSNNRNTYNDYFQPFPLDCKRKRQRYCKLHNDDNHQFIAF